MLERAVSELATVGNATTIVIAGANYTGTANQSDTVDMQDAGLLDMIDASITLKASDFTTLPKVNDIGVMNGVRYFIKRIANQQGILVLYLAKKQ